MKRHFVGSLYIPLIIFFSFLSCTRIETTDLGSELIPAVDNVNTFLQEMEIITNNALLNDDTRMYNQDHAIGLIANDPEFGKTEAVTYFTTEPAQFGAYPFVDRDSLIIDSVVLSLSFTSLYGDSNSLQTFEVREIDPSTSFRKDTAYRLTDPRFPTVGPILGSKQINFTTLNDTSYYRNIRDTVRSAKELRIRLDTTFGRRFVNFDTTTGYKNDSIFKSLFKGFEVKSSEGSPLKNALAYFDLSDNSRTKMTFYCRVTNNGKLDTILPTFIFASDPHANIINRTPANGFQSYLNNGNSTGDDLVYLQSTPGSYGGITIPQLTTFADTNRVIHRAELVIEVVSTPGENIFAPPAVLFLDATGVNGDSSFTIMNDFVPINEEPGYDISNFGGILNRKKYVFNISRYVQGMVTRKTRNYQLRVYAPFVAQPLLTNTDGTISTNRMYLILNSPVASGRVVVGGGNHPTQKMKLRIIYSEL